MIDAMFRRLAQVGRSIKREACFYRALARHPQTPCVARWCMVAAVGYALLPFDLIPDFIPVLGHLDDLLIVPALIMLGLWLVPRHVATDCRRLCNESAATLGD